MDERRAHAYRSSKRNLTRPELLAMIDDAILAGIELFATLNPTALDRLAAGGVLRRLAPDEELWRRGDEARGLHVVIEGEVRVVRDEDGRRRVLHTEGAGGTLGDVALFEGTVYPATAVATRRSTCATFDRATIIAALSADPTLALALLQRLAGRVRHLIDRIDSYAARSVSMRLAGHLELRSTLAAGAPFTLGGTQQAIAEELGTVREVIVRELRALRRAGVIDSAGRGRYRITDARALASLAH